LEQLVNHGYDYWALGHVHNRSVLNEDPWVVYPGNLQGRNTRETGSKGATLVEVVDGRVVSVEHRELDAVRWATIEVVVGHADERDGLLQRFREDLARVVEGAADRPIAVRLRLTGETKAHDMLLARTDAFREDVEALLATLPGEIWLERLEIKTTRPAEVGTVDPSVAGRLAAEMQKLRQDPSFAAVLAAKLAEVKVKIPASAHPDDLLERLGSEAPDRALDLALSFLKQGDET
jgi:DNA repair exonuclease SbcCD nuclease subunit